jgi:signal transduction histidine kinase
VRRALLVFLVGAFLTLVAESTDLPDPVAAVAVGALFAVLAAGGTLLVDRPGVRVPLRLAVPYVVGMLALGSLAFGMGGAGVGVTLLLMVLVSQSVLLLPLPAAVGVVLLIPFVHAPMELADALRNGLGTLAAAAFTAVVTELLQRERRARAELAAAHAQLRDHAAQAEQLATIQERNRLARDIHDGLGHHLTVVQMQIRAARSVLPSDPDRADAVLAKAQDQSAEALAEVRRSVAALREPRVRPALRDALGVLARDTSAAGVPTELVLTGTGRALPADVEESLFRAAQEGLTNVRKHAAAGSARLVLDYRDDGTVGVEVHDDGCGASRAGEGFGLLGLRERAARVGGRVDVESVPGGGTTLRLAVPG